MYFIATKLLREQSWDVEEVILYGREGRQKAPRLNLDLPVAELGRDFFLHALRGVEKAIHDGPVLLVDVDGGSLLAEKPRQRSGVSTGPGLNPACRTRLRGAVPKFAPAKPTRFPVAGLVAH